MNNERLLADLAKTAIKEWDLDVEDIKLHLQSENTVFKVEGADGNTYALRIHRKGYHDLDELNSEHIWTSCLSKSGLSVPQALLTRNGVAYASIAFPNSEENRYVGLVEWLEGENLSKIITKIEEHEIRSLYRSLGKVIAKFHQATIAWEVPKGFKRHSFDRGGLLGEKPFWGRFWEVESLSNSDYDELSLIRNNLKEVLMGLPKDKTTFGMIHADLHSDNVLVKGDILSVIDFDDSGFGWHGFDLAVAIWDRLDFSANGGFFEVAHEGLLEGYLEDRPNTKAIIGTIPIFLLMRSLMLIGWIHERPEAGYSDFLPVLIQASKAQAKDLGLSD